jgi:peptide/nickel transport system permease protein
VLRLVATRLAAGFLTLLAASALIFLTVDLLPGDSATAFLGRDAASDPKAVAQLREEYGLDRPILVRYLDWVSGAVRFEFGESPANRQPVADLIGPRLKRTAVLLGISLALIFPLALFVGTVSALHRGSLLDAGLQVWMLVLASLPSFIVGIALIVVFSLIWHLLPAVSLGLTPESLVLPTATLVLGWMPFTARMVRAGVVGALESDYVQMARLKGLSEQRVVRSHVLPNSLVPAIQAFALTAAGMPAGIVIVEYLFGFQGIGVFLIDAVRARDVATVEAISLILVAVYVVANLLSDIATTLLTPRLRTAELG